MEMLCEFSQRNSHAVPNVNSRVRLPKESFCKSFRLCCNAMPFVSTIRKDESWNMLQLITFFFAQCTRRERETRGGLRLEVKVMKLQFSLSLFTIEIKHFIDLLIQPLRRRLHC